ncbi:hypothetical protein E2C01_027939 [Portunus trituberculatus]|uniref:Uncharacterized protein n=1 Tax=Portunus trituberculatus TaxID=210409 RepID=A0A5B7EM96_PORTR|nr:hypothetical protein [Portunus trituberculatus]
MQVECQLLRVADRAHKTEEWWRQAQREETELAPVIQCKEDSAARLSWQQMVDESPGMKHLWQQWALLCLQDGKLQRHWEDTWGRASYWVVLVPHALWHELF